MGTVLTLTSALVLFWAMFCLVARAAKLNPCCCGVHLPPRGNYIYCQGQQVCRGQLICVGEGNCVQKNLVESVQILHCAFLKFSVQKEKEDISLACGNVFL